MKPISREQFKAVDLRAGTILEAAPFPEARKPAYKLTVDFGEDIGIKMSSAQITDRYSREALVGRQVIGVVNLPPKKIGPFVSECLITGFYNKDDEVALAVPDGRVPNGTRLC